MSTPGRAFEQRQANFQTCLRPGDEEEAPEERQEGEAFFKPSFLMSPQECGAFSLRILLVGSPWDCILAMFNDSGCGGRRARRTPVELPANMTV